MKGKPVPDRGERPQRGRAERCSSRAASSTPRARSRRSSSRGESLDAPEKLFSPELWDAIYGVPKGEVTIEHIQHAFYMAANYGFQILNGNFAAAIDDYELKLRFMNDLATYRINVSWLWTLVQHQAAITRDGHLQRQALTEDGVVLGENAEPVKAGTPLRPGSCSRRSGTTTTSGRARSSPSRTGAASRAASTAPRRPSSWSCCSEQLLSPRYIQHSARVLFVVGQANAAGSDGRSWRRSSTSTARRSCSA